MTVYWVTLYNALDCWANELLTLTVLCKPDSPLPGSPKAISPINQSIIYLLTTHQAMKQFEHQDETSRTGALMVPLI